MDSYGEGGSVLAWGGRQWLSMGGEQAQGTRSGTGRSNLYGRGAAVICTGSAFSVSVKLLATVPARTDAAACAGAPAWQVAVSARSSSRMLG